MWKEEIKFSLFEDNQFNVIRVIMLLGLLCLSPGSLSHNFEKRKSQTRVSKAGEFIEIEK
jgi:hypothetical protein